MGEPPPAPVSAGEDSGRENGLGHETK